MAVLVRWLSVAGASGATRYLATVSRAGVVDPTSPFEHRLHVWPVREGWAWVVVLAPCLGADVGTGRGVTTTVDAAMLAAESWLEAQPFTGVPPAPASPSGRLPVLYPPSPESSSPTTFTPGRAHRAFPRHPWAPRVIRSGRRRRYGQESA